MAKNSVQIAGPDLHVETIVTFRKEKDKTFTKIIKTRIRDWKTSQVKSGKDKDVEAGSFRLVTESHLESDETIMYEDIDGSHKYLYFRKIDDAG
jgi:hypothetical protein